MAPRLTARTAMVIVLAMPLASATSLAPIGSAAVVDANVAAARCAPAGARIVAADDRVEAYVAREPFFAEGRGHRRLGTLVSYRGCAYGSRRSYRLGIVGVGSSRGGVLTDRVTVAGVFVAFESVSVVTGSEAEFRVVVRNLQTGRTVASAPTGVPLRSRPHYVGVGSVLALVLSARGTAAWIAGDILRSEATTHESGREVEYYDLYALGSGSPQLLASGADLQPGSLTLAGSTLYWTQAGKPFSSALP